VCDLFESERAPRPQVTDGSLLTFDGAAQAREAGADKVYFLSYSSPVKFPCYYGIDMQTKGEFIANRNDLEGIARELGADRVIYQEVDAMVRSARAGNDKIGAFCSACFTGCYPAGTVTDEERAAIEAERRAVAAS